MSIVFPWNDIHFEGSPFQKQLVYGNLKRIGLPVDKWKNVPSPKVAGGVGKVLPGIMEKKWQLVCSDSAEVLQAIAELCPIIYSLSTHSSSILVDTTKLIARFLLDTWGPEDISKTDDIAWQAKVAQLMCWFNVSEVHKDGARYHYRFSDILLRRKSLDRATVFLALFIVPRGKNFSMDSVDSIFNKIKAGLGDMAASIIREMSVVQYLDVGLSKQEPVRSKL